MGLVQNGMRHVTGGKVLGGDALIDGGLASIQPSRFNSASNRMNYTAGGAITDDLAAVPAGARHPVAWIMPRKAGGLSSHNEASGSVTATLSMASGINIEGLAEGTTPTAEATLQLVVSMLATAAGEATTNANLNAALLLAGTANGEATNNAIITALAWAIGQANGEATATLVRYATGELKGSISPFTELSPEGLAAAVWNSLVAQYQEDGTMGKALGTASSGGVDLDLMAQAVWEYVTRTLTASGLSTDEHNAVMDLAKINGLIAGTDAIVSPTGRTAGGVTQTFTDDAGTVTISRA